MILGGAMELLTSSGDWELDKVVKDNLNVWNGSRWVNIRPKRLENYSFDKKYEFVVSYTYPGCKLDHGITFETYLVGSNLKVKLLSGLVVDVRSLDFGEYLWEYTDNKSNKYSAFFAGKTHYNSDITSAFEVNEKNDFIVNGLMVYSN